MIKRLTTLTASLALLAANVAACPVSLRLLPLKTQIEQIIARQPGRIGACVHDGTDFICAHGHDPFSLQSVVKLLTAMAVLDGVDRQKMTLDDSVLVTAKDLVGGVQPIEKQVGPNGYTTTIGDLVRRMIIDSDTAANDIMMEKLGGPQAVQDFLNRKNITGIRVDSDERRLQSRIAGLTWRSAYSERGALQRAIDAVPKDTRDAAYKNYQTDPRDTATPKGMIELLDRLLQRDLLSSASTGFILNAMRDTKTMRGRLQAGVPEGWTVGHKTGTSSTWNGITVASNDVGFLTAPDGRQIAITVFVADSPADAATRDAIIADIARATVAHYSRK